MSKREIRIKGCMDEIVDGGRATLILCNGEVIKTSPVVFHSVHGGVIYVETQNSVYCNV